MTIIRNQYDQIETVKKFEDRQEEVRLHSEERRWERIFFASSNDIGKTFDRMIMVSDQDMDFSSG